MATGFTSPPRRPRTRRRVKRTGHMQALVVMGGADSSKGCRTNTDCWYLKEMTEREGPVSEIPRLPEFRTFTELPEECPAFGVSICGLPGGFLVTGGRTESGEVVATCRRYISATQTWVEHPDLPTPRYGHTALYFKSKLYIAGGRSRSGSDPENVEDDVNKIMYCQNTKGNWEELSFPEAADVPRIVGDRKRNFLWYYNDSTGSLYSFDLKTLRWCHRTTIPDTRDENGKLHCRGASITCFYSTVYVAGGVRPILATYDAGSDRWVIGPTPTYRHIAPTLVHRDHKLYLLGGGTEHVEEYHEFRKQWSVAPFTVPKNLYVMTAVEMNVWGPKVEVRMWNQWEHTDASETGSDSYMPPLQIVVKQKTARATYYGSLSP